MNVLSKELTTKIWPAMVEAEHMYGPGQGRAKLHYVLSKVLTRPDAPSVEGADQVAYDVERDNTILAIQEVIKFACESPPVRAFFKSMSKSKCCCAA